MNTLSFSKYGAELLNKVGGKTSDSNSLSPSLKRAKFVKKLDMKVTTLQSYGLLRRDTRSPQVSYSGPDSDSIKTDSGKKAETERRLVQTDEYSIDPNNVVASIHKNISRQQMESKRSKQQIESRDDENGGYTSEQDGRDLDLAPGVGTDSEKKYEIDDEDDCDSVCIDCFKAACTLSVDDIYNEEELLGLAFIPDF